MKEWGLARIVSNIKPVVTKLRCFIRYGTRPSQSLLSRRILQLQCACELVEFLISSLFTFIIVRSDLLLKVFSVLQSSFVYVQAYTPYSTVVKTVALYIASFVYLNWIFLSILCPTLWPVPFAIKSLPRYTNSFERKTE